MDYEQNGETRTERILIIEDDPDTARFVEIGLRSVGFPDITIERDGDAGLELIKREDFDLVLCDFAMPGLSGDEVVQRVRADARSRNLPVIMLTAQAGLKHLLRAMEVGADDYITKPFDPLDCTPVSKRSFAAAPAECDPPRPHHSVQSVVDRKA